MHDRGMLIVLVAFALTSGTTSHVSEHGIADQSVVSTGSINYSLNGTTWNQNVTYFSYHIHVYFMERNRRQANEATVLRNRFLAQFHVGRCDGDCETWCPRICHWTLNKAPAG